jgi:RNA binding exosome subunit
VLKVGHSRFPKNVHERSIVVHMTDTAGFFRGNPIRVHMHEFRLLNVDEETFPHTLNIGSNFSLASDTGKVSRPYTEALLRGLGNGDNRVTVAWERNNLFIRFDKDLTVDEILQKEDDIVKVLVCFLEGRSIQTGHALSNLV